MVSQYNSWIRNYIPNIRILDIQNILSTTDDLSGVPDNNYFLADEHPNVAGNHKIFDLFKSMFFDIKSDL